MSPANLASRARVYRELALISLVIVYLEVVVIRWLASEVRIFAYFKNFPLLAAFLGFGIGCILASRNRNYFRFAPLLLLLLSAVISLAHLAGYTHITFADPYEHYILGHYNFENPVATLLQGSAIVLAIFVLIVALFTSLGEKLGQCLNEFPPLPAYGVNVAFSLLGILIFAALSWLRTGPGVWIFLACLGLAPFFWRTWRFLPALGAFLLPVFLVPASVVWSPYYRVDVEPASLSDEGGNLYPVGHHIRVNHDGFMGAYDHRPEFIEQLPTEVREQLLDYYNVSYRIFGPRFYNVLILGAGAGNDVAAALRNGAETIDAVEIDGTLVEIGRILHPEAVYASDRVHPLIGDARTVLRNPEFSGYDLIVFAALDSHSVFSAMSSLRLDNYVYTVGAFSEAMRRLGPDGVIAVTFYAFKEWQLERVYNALWKANGSKPVVVRSLGNLSNNLVMLAGPGAERDWLLAHPYVQAQNAESLVGSGTVEPTTDDWPFLFLRKRGIPFSYVLMLTLILSFSYAAARRASEASSSSFNWVMFLLGVGFMLLETKVLATIALLVGATWVVNTFVIGAVLLMIFLANLAVMRQWFTRVRFVVAALLGAILLDWVFQFNTLTLVSSPGINLSLILLALTLPIFFAGILFSNLFRLEQSPGLALGYNLFGAMVGGVLEYSSMAWGINNLNMMAVAAYAGVAILALRPLSESQRVRRV